MPSLQDIATVTGLVIGVAGFIFGFYQWHVSRRDKQPHLSVTIKESTMTDTIDNILVEVSAFDINIINVGQQSLRLENFEVKHNRQTLILTSSLVARKYPIPGYLDPNHKAQFSIAVHVLRERFRNLKHTGKGKVQLAFVDSEGKRYKANRTMAIDFDNKSWVED
jgi:hypothetical protein